MFTRHETDFADIHTTLAVKGAMLRLSADTMLETELGWTMVADLTPQDRVATLDGGFVDLAWVGRLQEANSGVQLPAGALDNCSGLILPSDTLIGMEAPLAFDATSDHISLPLAAFAGQNGIMEATGTIVTRTLGFETEEMIWAQTGMLLHARPMAGAFFQTLRYDAARALLADMKHAQIPDAVAA